MAQEKAPERGFRPAGSYALRIIETISTNQRRHDAQDSPGVVAAGTRRTFCVPKPHLQQQNYTTSSYKRLRQIIVTTTLPT